MSEVFQDRTQAGKKLASRLSSRKKDKNLAVVAIPRGGVVVAYEISNSLHLPLLPLVVKKIPTPGVPELASGAMAPEGLFLGEKSKSVERLINKRIKRYGGLPDFRNKNIILVDDGIATGATIETAISYLKEKNAGEITVAVPVVSKFEFRKIKKLVSNVVALKIPETFDAIGEFYRDFSQVSDAKVIQLLERSLL